MTIKNRGKRSWILAVPILAASLLAGCSNEAEVRTFANTPGITPSIHQNVTPEESNFLDAGKSKVEVGDGELKYVPLAVTDTNRMKDEERLQHYRLAFDTSELAPTCQTAKAKVSESSENSGDCITSVMLRATGVNQSVVYAAAYSFEHGRNVLEFDGDKGLDFTAVITMNSGRGIDFNAVTGEVTFTDKQL